MLLSVVGFPLLQLLKSSRIASFTASMLSPGEQIVTEGNSSSVVGFAASWNRIFFHSFKIGLSSFDLQSSDCQVGLPVIVAGDTQVDRKGEARDKESSRPSLISYTGFRISNMTNSWNIKPNGGENRPKKTMNSWQRLRKDVADSMDS